MWSMCHDCASNDQYTFIYELVNTLKTCLFILSSFFIKIGIIYAFCEFEGLSPTEPASPPDWFY
jgi:hypothetical protein